MRVTPLLVLAVSLGGSNTWAADKVSSHKPLEPIQESQVKAAKKACATGDFKTGIEILADLFVQSNNPIYVHNQGRCYQQNGRYEEAIERFREFLRKEKKLSSDDRASVEGYIAECQSLL